ncbi:MAG: DEAD/DEAH box helicase family protein [Endomicrobium sp.]|nr:DEAD/DEAH box helicase family protein [Endomicrobium sp.]
MCCNTKDFQYDVQPYQEECINNIISIFRELSKDTPFKEVISKHLSKFNYNYKTSDAKNIDILMETGTGKTFTFIKTMFELNKNFKYKKFIILVPSVAIREGTQTAFQDTKNYFKSYYANSKDKEVTIYIYQKSSKTEIEHFINDPELFSCLIMTPSSFNTKNNILNRCLEKDFFQPAKSYLELLKLLNPIVIIDEPHKFDGKAFKKYFKGFNNYYFRFGAAFPYALNSIPLSNTAYILDSISAFRQNLVKQITVHTQDVINAAQRIVKIENKQAIVNNFKNGQFTKQQSILSTGDTFNGKLITKILKDKVILNTGEIITVDYNLTPEAIRLMISDAVKIHFEKEADLFNKGIKTLCLFFIQHTVQYRSKDKSNIKTIFEEEYKNIREQKIKELQNKTEYENYLNYLKRDYNENGILNVHKGYFSGDRGSKDEQIKQGIDEILKDKKKLLSFSSSTRFIFSIWALQEGWDNPNIFTICRLSNNGTETSKFQQIGRGLRICVNQNLERQNIKLFNENQEEFWKINNLDVIVSNQEAGFAESIQNEIIKNSHLLNDTFTELDLIKTIKNKNEFKDTVISELISFMKKKNLIIFKESDKQGNKIYTRAKTYREEIELLKDSPQSIPAPLMPKHIKAIENIFPEDIKNYVKDAGSIKKKQIHIKDKHFKNFKELWEKINQNSIYFIDNLTNENEKNLIVKTAKDINNLNINKIFLHKKKTVIEAGKPQDRLITIDEEEIIYKSKIDYLALACSLAADTKTPLSFISKIINALTPDFKQNMLKNDVAQAQREMSAIIKNNLIETIKANINYCGIDGNILNTGIMYDDKGNFKRELPAGSLGKTQEIVTDNFSLKEEWIFDDILEYDSNFEKEIILEDSKTKNIKIFGKMPKLKIKTPLGSYSPDFCYAIGDNSGTKIFLIVESKGYDTIQNIPEEEKCKIDFAKKFFNKVNEKFKNENIKIMYEERIKKTDLESLIQKALEGTKI